MNGFDTKAIHARPPREVASNDITSPIHVTSSYAFEDAETVQELFRGQGNQFVYGRVHNPTQELLEWRLKEMECAEAAVVTASGMAAIASFFLSIVRPGDEVVAHQCLYGNTFRFLREAMRDFGVTVKFVDLRSPEMLAPVLNSKTRCVFFETPTNPFIEVLDIRAIAAQCESVGALCVVDSTLASPALLQPLRHGASVVIHSLTKYIGGHGDLLGGAVIGPAEIVKAIRGRGLRFLTGATISPFAAYLALRGIKTLGLRMSRHSASARVVAGHLRSDPRVAKVFYPELAQAGGDPAAHKYLPNGAGGVLSFRLAAGAATVPAFLNRLKLAKIAVSLGTCETLAEHPASMTHSSYTEAGGEQEAIPADLVRLALGLENAEDLIDDLDSALLGT